MIKQLIGIIGFIFLGISNLQKERKNIILYQTLACFFFSFHYYLINALTASILNFVGIARGVVFYNKNKFDKKYIMYLILFIALYLTSGILTYENIFSILPVLAYILYIISVFNEKEIIMKLINFIVSTIWLIYDIAYKSYAGMINDTFMLITILFGIIIIKKNKVLK